MKGWQPLATKTACHSVTLRPKVLPVALIKSISGIRGTIGGEPGQNLTPIDIVRFTAAFATVISNKSESKSKKIVIGRDGRISGKMVSELCANTLLAMGFDVVDLGLSTTPTVEIAVAGEKAAAGIILTASHNPKEWNALKLLNHKGEFIDDETGHLVLDTAAKEEFKFASIDKLGNYTSDDSYLKKHVDAILNYGLVDKEAVSSRNYKIVVDGINSTGSIFVPELLRALGVKDIIVINEKVTGEFNHNPEPLPGHLTELGNTVVQQKASLGIAVDPDVDRLCFVCEDGSMFGEEYTLVAVADYVLSQQRGNTVSNLSSTKSLKEITLQHGGEYFPSAVGEVNVVKKMKEVNAVIGGEGNGGVIVPDFHYGRDALIGIGLFLTHLAKSGTSIKKLRTRYPDYFISKNKINLEKGTDVKRLLSRIREKYKDRPINEEDGLKIEFENDWVHLRASNTEPVIRIYSESNFETTAENIAKKIMADIREEM